MAKTQDDKTAVLMRPASVADGGGRSCGFSRPAVLLFYAFCVPVINGSEFIVSVVQRNTLCTSCFHSSSFDIKRAVWSSFVSLLAIYLFEPSLLICVFVYVAVMFSCCPFCSSLFWATVVKRFAYAIGPLSCPVLSCPVLSVCLTVCL